MRNTPGIGDRDDVDGKRGGARAGSTSGPRTGAAPPDGGGPTARRSFVDARPRRSGTRTWSPAAGRGARALVVARAGVVAIVAVVCLAGATCARDKAGGAPSTGAAASPTTGAALNVAPQAQPLFAPQAPGKRLVVLFTASVEGYVEPCGCTADPLGGVARLAAAVDDARRAYGDRVVFVDAGDLLFEEQDVDAADQCQDDARAKLLLATYARKGLAATTLGAKDDARGPAWRDQRVAAAGLFTVGAHRPLGAGAQGARFRVVDAGPSKVAIVAVRADSSDAIDDAARRLRDDVAAAGAVDVVVALVQAPRGIAKRVLQGSGVDAALLGRDPGEAPAAPERVDDRTILYAAGEQSQYVGVLEIDLDGRAPGAPLALDDRAAELARRGKVLDARVKEYEAQLTELPDGERKQFLAQRLDAARQERADLAAQAAAPRAAGPGVVFRAIPLPRGMVEEATAAAGLAAYESSVPTLVASCEKDLVCPPPPQGAATFVGAASCKECHAAAYAFWQQQHVTLPAVDDDGKPITRRLSHAKAFDTLVADKKDKDRTCVPCHVVGFGLPGGVCKTSDAAKLPGVQCESCHGPGSLHVSSAGVGPIARDAPEATCRGCHKVPHIPSTESFRYDEKLKLILSQDHGRARLEKLPR